jgi:branched-chain amino acid transport system permease protein
MITSLLGVLFDGLAYGMLLFLISVGLSVTLGLMNFINLAHGAFAMLGGYVCVLALQRWGLPFIAALPAAFVISALAGLLLERVLYRYLYRRSHLDQVLATIGLTFMAIAAASYFFGPMQQALQVPRFLSGQISVLGVDLNIYRGFLLAAGAALTVALTLALERTRFGASVRAAVDRPRVAEALGIRVGLVFQVTFAVGCGLAGLGGALGVQVLGLDPAFPLKFIVYFLLVVAVGGTSGLKGPLYAALLLGVIDVAGKYYVPQIGAFIIYAMMVILLVLRPQGLVSRK